LLSPITPLFDISSVSRKILSERFQLSQVIQKLWLVQSNLTGLDAFPTMIPQKSRSYGVPGPGSARVVCPQGTLCLLKMTLCASVRLRNKLVYSEGVEDLWIAGFRLVPVPGIEEIE
jgi:hypothetical protein